MIRILGNWFEVSGIHNLNIEVQGIPMILSIFPDYIDCKWRMVIRRNQSDIIKEDIPEADESTDLSTVKYAALMMFQVLHKRLL